MFTFQNFLGIPVTVVTDDKTAEKAYMKKAQKIPGFKLISNDTNDDEKFDVPAIAAAMKDAIPGLKTEIVQDIFNGFKPQILAQLNGKEVAALIPYYQNRIAKTGSVDVDELQDIIDGLKAAF